MDIKDFVKRENREKLAKEFTKEGLFELKEETIRGNKYQRQNRRIQSSKAY